MAIIRGTTPTIVFTFTDFDPTEAQKVLVTFSNGLEITEDDLEITSDSISLWLSQAQTLEMTESIVNVQINFLFDDGQRVATPIKRIDWELNLHNKVMR